MKKVEIKKMPVLLVSGYGGDTPKDSSPSDYQITIFKVGSLDIQNRPTLGIVYEDAFGEFYLQQKNIDDVVAFYDVDKALIEKLIGMDYDNC